ncbi:MAG: Bax inhibitor-1/YccA family protein [Lachnospiraceae bacterium]|nr:Bax inhibitor-1/YccA family protein [Lachnospiraceae bacterium]
MKKAFYKVLDFIKKIVGKVFALIFPESTPAPEGEPYCTLEGMWRKVFYYSGMILAGLVGYFIIHYVCMDILEMTPVTIELENSENMTFKFFESGTYSLSKLEWVIFLITFLSIALTPIIRFFPFAALFIDTLYCISVGYNTSFMYWGVAQQDMRVAAFTLIISILLCVIPYVMFKNHKIQLPQHFSKIVYILFWTLVMGSSIFRVLSFIPGVSVVARFLYDIYNAPGAGEIFLLIRIVIYFLFLFMCLERLLEFVRNKTPKKFEWTMTFHLMYTITILINYCISFVMTHTDVIMLGIKMMIDKELPIE